jgi:hypothetical protein
MNLELISQLVEDVPERKFAYPRKREQDKSVVTSQPQHETGPQANPSEVDFASAMEAEVSKLEQQVGANSYPELPQFEGECDNGTFSLNAHDSRTVSVRGHFVVNRVDYSVHASLHLNDATGAWESAPDMQPRRRDNYKPASDSAERILSAELGNWCGRAIDEMLSQEACHQAELAAAGRAAKKHLGKLQRATWAVRSAQDEALAAYEELEAVLEAQAEVTADEPASGLSKLLG